MNYTVFWTPDAEQELAAAWLAASDRDAVALMAHRLEQRLRADPRAVGDARRSSVERVVYAAPLSLSFMIIVDDLKVFVTAVHLIS
jgi:hypothetical protein